MIADTVELMVGAIDVIALSFAIKATTDSKKVLNQTRLISDSVSTRFIGTFPEQVEKLAELVSRANTSVHVLWDAADMGSYVNPPSHLTLLNALVERARFGVKDITFLVCGDPQNVSRATAARMRGYNASDVRRFCESISRPAFLSRLSNLRDSLTRSRDVTSLDNINHVINARGFSENMSVSEASEAQRAFSDLQACYHSWVVELLEMSGATVNIVTEGKDGQRLEPEVFFFVVDSSEAIFLLTCPNMDALAFRTRDPKLVETFEDIFKSRLA